MIKLSWTGIAGDCGHGNEALTLSLLPLTDKVSGDVIQNAFSTMEEEEAIAEITKDFEFARKLIKEKNQLLNPNAKYVSYSTFSMHLFSTLSRVVLCLGFGGLLILPIYATKFVSHMCTEVISGIVWRNQELSNSRKINCPFLCLLCSLWKHFWINDTCVTWWL